ncbi:MAG TPA: DUF503 family protein [Bdellovibrionota bacterium]|jgi:uncharacterized protein YlxP (DUF503 family)
MKKRRSPDRPVCFFGKITFEFFNNDDEDFKARSLKSLSKEVRKECNISCHPVEEHEVENPERGTLAVSLVAANHDQGKAVLDKALAYFDGKAPARILLEDFEESEIT